MIKVQLGRRFNPSYRLLVEHNPSLRIEIDKRVVWFRKNPDDTRLRNHFLRKKMKGKFAFGITDDVRIVYESVGKNTVRFLAIGGHKVVYGRF